MRDRTDTDVVDLRREREIRIHSEIARLAQLQRLLVIDASDADIAIAALEDELEALHHQQGKATQ